MKNDYFYDAIEFENLYQALKKCCKNVRWKDSIARYEQNALINTLHLRESLLNGTYKISKYKEFTIYEPKERQIQAAAIVDRQFQQSLCDAGLYEDITEHFILDNVACQRGKGTSFAFDRFKHHLQKFATEHQNKGYALKCDVSKFFPSTSHSVAKEVATKYISDYRALLQVYMLIDSFGGDKGIGLGSPISQLIQLAVLNSLDHYIKEQLHIKYYIRYMDDFILIHEDKNYLRYCLTKIEEELTKIDLKLNPKTNIFSLSHGVDFLNWNFKITDSGKVLMLVDSNKIYKFKHKIKKLWEFEQQQKSPIGSTYQVAQSFLEYLKVGNTKHICKQLTQYIFDVSGGVINLSNKLHTQNMIDFAESLANKDINGQADDTEHATLELSQMLEDCNNAILELSEIINYLSKYIERISQ